MECNIGGEDSLAVPSRGTLPHNFARREKFTIPTLFGKAPPMLKTRLFAVLFAAFITTVGVAAQDRKPTSSDKANFGASRTEIYKKIGKVELKLFVFNPPEHKASDQRAAVVFFFGGGWKNGTPKQFVPQCEYLASRGMVAITADYRVHSRHQAQVKDCVADAKSAIRWVRANAAKLGVDPHRIASGGGSAGGHLGAAVGTLDGFEDKNEDASVSSRPNAMLLFNPALDLRAEAFGRDPKEKRHQEFLARMGADVEKLSPTLNVHKQTPPTIIFHGKADPTVPYAQAERFAEAMKKHGLRCVVAGFEGQAHGFFNHGRNGNKNFIATMRQADEFLISLGYLSGEPTIEK
ncbi:MAG: alpha/beta hydrolase [Planctomycetales bacterium]